jgi:transposase
VSGLGAGRGAAAAAFAAGRLVCNARRYLGRTGCGWRCLPPPGRLGKPGTSRGGGRATRWFEPLLAELRELARWLAGRDSGLARRGQYTPESGARAGDDGQGQAGQRPPGAGGRRPAGPPAGGGGRALLRKGDGNLLMHGYQALLAFNCCAEDTGLEER